MSKNHIRVPILKQGDLLIASVQEDLSDTEIVHLQERLLAEVVRTRARGIIIDVTTVEVLDSYGTRVLSEIAQGVQLRGARLVIVGIQPEVALAMVLLGITMPEVSTALDLENAIKMLRQPAG